MRKFSVILAFITLLFTNLSTAQASLLQSGYFKDDATANAIIEGVVEKDINEFNISYDQSQTLIKGDTATFAYKVLNAMRQLGYTFRSFVKPPSETMLNKFQKDHSLPETTVITKDLLLAIDQILYEKETEDKELANQFPMSFLDPPPNEPPKEHLIAIFTRTFQALPPYLAPWGHDDFLGSFQTQLPESLAGGCDPVNNVCYQTSGIFLCGYNYNPQLARYCGFISQNVDRFGEDDFSYANILFHEHAHYMDGSLYQKEENTAKGIIDTHDFYEISFYTNDTGPYGFKRFKSSKCENFLSVYGGGSGCVSNDEYGAPAEDFAESFSMYVLEGKVFREFAKTSAIVAQKYEWLKTNVFDNLEYDTGNSNYIDVLSPSMPRSGNVHMYSTDDPDFVWDYKFATIGCKSDCLSWQSRCNGNIVQTCGNYDSDTCLEWPLSTSGSGNSACTGSAVCSNNQCVPAGLNAAYSPETNELVATLSDTVGLDYINVDVYGPSNSYYGNACLRSPCMSRWVLQPGQYNYRIAAIYKNSKPQITFNGSFTVTVNNSTPATSSKSEQLSANMTNKLNEILPGQETSIAVDKEKTSIDRIRIEVKNLVKNVDANIVKLKEKPSQITQDIAGKVYEYLELNLANATETDIEKVTIGFRVGKTWIANNKINKATVQLNRYSDENWHKIPTVMISEDSEFVYYEAQAPGFSIFAITGEELGTPTVCASNERRCIGNSLEECNADGTSWLTLETCRNGCNDKSLSCNVASTEEVGISPYLFFAISIVVITVGVIYLVKRKKPKENKEYPESITLDKLF